MDYVGAGVYLDPFGGIGTTMIGCDPNPCVLVEIEDEYVDVAKQIRDYNSWQDRVSIICQDNRLALPIPCDHIITSPPYGSDLFKTEKQVEIGKSKGSAIEMAVGDQVEQYGKDPQNIGRLNNFFYRQVMLKLYKKMVDSVRSGGAISITPRERMLGGKRVLPRGKIIKKLTQHGMRLEGFEKWEAPGSFQSRVNESMGLEVVLDEDILIFRKPL